MNENSSYVTNKWGYIDDLVRRWARRFPEEYQDNLKWVQLARDEYVQEKYKERSLRKGLMLHPRLIIYIQHFYRDFLDTNDDVREFSRRFPAFVVDDGVKAVKR